MPSKFISAMPSNTVQPPSKPPIYKRKWFIVVVIILFLGLIGSCVNGGNGSRSNSESSASASATASSDNASVAPSSTENETESSKIANPVELDTLQQIFCSLNNSMTKDEVDAIVNENNLYVNDSFKSAYYIGYEYQATASRGRDREGAAIDINFTDDGKIKNAQYALHTGFSTHYGPELANNKFTYDGVDYDSGEEALYVYLAEQGVNAQSQANLDDSSDKAANSSEVIYPANESVNDFVVAFNEAHPDLAISADDLTVYHHHGSNHPDQVWTHLGDDRVLLSGSSVYYETYSENKVVQDYADANHRVFSLVMPLFDSDLDEATVETRWQELLDDLTNSPTWDDGIGIETGHGSDEGGPGSFGYIKITKHK